MNVRIYLLNNNSIFSINGILRWTTTRRVNQLLSFAKHRYLHVLQLMITPELQDRKHGQTHPDAEAAPSSKLRCSKFNVKASGVDLVLPINVIASRKFARGETFRHAITPGHKPKCYDYRCYQCNCRQVDRDNHVDECRQESAVFALVHVTRKSVDLRGWGQQKNYTHDHGVATIGFRCPIHCNLPISLLPNARWEQQTISPENDENTMFNINRR